VLRDKHTQQYFNSVPQGYTSVKKHMESGFIELIQDLGPTRVLDTGCGQGSFLELVHEACPASELFGLDFSLGMLLAAPKVASLVVGSVWYPPFRTDSFDVVHLDALLHHLIGATRNECRVRAQEALHQAVSLIKPGGHLLVLEFFYEPALAGFLIFWLKKLVCFLSGGRRMHGLGAPVTSFYTRANILQMITASGASLKTAHSEMWSLGRSKTWGALPSIMRYVIGFRWGRLCVVAAKERGGM
jgi:ubiquinone/menaquinone biosynthesis C-methylase UbiE